MKFAPKTKTIGLQLMIDRVKDEDHAKDENDWTEVDDRSRYR